jgi:prepilin-type N-terminal cleavage/methylation domain-containing protein
MRNQRGFSLLEILAALLILTVVITVSFTAFYERTRRLQQAAEIVLAYQALSNEAEYRRRIEFDELKTELKFRSSTEILAPLAPYEAVVTVPKQTQPGIRNVTMKIRWRNGEREARLTLVRTKTGATNLW